MRDINSFSLSISPPHSLLLRYLRPPKAELISHSDYRSNEPCLSFLHPFCVNVTETKHGVGLLCIFVHESHLTEPLEPNEEDENERYASYNEGR